MTVHTVETMLRARQLADMDPDRSMKSIARELGVSDMTVKRWIDPAAAELINAKQRRNHHRRQRVGRLERRLFNRMVSLRLAGLSNGAVAAVLNLDEGTDRFNDASVRGYLKRYAPSLDLPQRVSHLSHDNGNFSERVA